MTTVTTCSNMAEAELIKSVLEEADIPAFALDEIFGGSIRVQVEDEHAAEARRLLAELEAAPPQPDEGEEQPRG
jgi:hypothetical protein